MLNEELGVTEFEHQAGPHAPLAHSYLAALLRGDRQDASRMILSAAESSVDVRDIYMHVFQPAQLEIGRLWQTNAINVAQEHYCTAATQLIMSQLAPYIFGREKNGRRMVATCVNGELHEIGARMVADFFELAGWDAYYLGASTPARSVLEAVAQREAQLLAISATIHFNVAAAMDLIRTIRQSPDAARLKIIVGGRSFNIAPDLWQKVGADGYASDAAQSVAAATLLLDA
jgi:MerR family transcriptional regulator, light-induced transcriptional regulator